MIAGRTLGCRRSGVAAVECSVVLTFLIVPMMIGLWEVGRLVFVQQVLSSACREGARLAAQGKTIGSDGTPSNIQISSGNPNVKNTVFLALVTGGLPEVTAAQFNATGPPPAFQFQFLTPYVKANSTDPDPTEPYNAQKGQPYRITVTLQWANLRWINLGLINPTTVTYQVDWNILVDDPFTVVTTLPNW